MQNQVGNKVNVLSLFDGLSGAKIALDNLGIHVEYYSSEIDRYAIQVSLNHFPEIHRLGNVIGVTKDMLPADIFLLVGGSPCQGLSISRRNRQGLQDLRSGLFYEYLRVFQEVKPRYFLLENVASMGDPERDTISSSLGTEPIMINSALVTAQNRKRYYWTNIPGVKQPKDEKIYLKDIIDHAYTERDKSLCMVASYYNSSPQDYFYNRTRQYVFNKPVKIGYIGKGSQGERIYSVNGKSVCLSANGGGRGAKTGLYEISQHVRKLTPIECERLQGLPEKLTEGVSNTQRYKMIGNGFTVPVIQHILSYIPEFGLKEQEPEYKQLVLF